MENEERIDKINTILEETERDGFKKGLTKGYNALLILSNVIPGTVTKQWILDEAGRQAELLWRIIEEK